jgi:hypothetical protein
MDLVSKMDTSFQKLAHGEIWQSHGSRLLYRLASADNERKKSRVTGVVMNAMSVITGGCDHHASACGMRAP